MENLYTKQEAKDILGLSLASLNRYMSMGEIDYIKYNGKCGAVRFTREQIESFLKKYTVSQKSNGGEK